MEIELRHLRMLVAVAECGSVTKVSAVLGLAQPALTAQLNRIDRALGGPVFVRDRAGSRPTELGLLVLRHARVLLPAAAAMRDDVRHLLARAVDDARPLHLGTVSTVLGGLFVNALYASRAGVRVRMSTSWSPAETARHLESGELDVALVGSCPDATLPAGRGVVWWRLYDDPVCVLLADDHPLAARSQVHLGELADESWLSAPGDGCFERCFVAACARSGFTPRGMGEGDRESVVEQVRAGHGVALVQPLLLDAPGVRVVGLAGEPLRWTHSLGRGRAAGERWDDALLVAAAQSAHDEAVRRTPRAAATDVTGHTAAV
ncbi:MULTISPECIES: LysR family transcriptional regulator [unclassified Isoptericola]|uniref:LysR family transcriptional regulator n=1 Tax=unclassified Isoptericola TaxID=2623355 RepID=UPI00364A1102